MKSGFLKAMSYLTLLYSFSVAADSEYIHLEGKYACRELHDDKLQLVSDDKTFDVYLGQTNYYFLIANKDGDWAGTYDGMDYFRVKYFFPLAQQATIPGSKSNLMGAAEVGFGSFPSNAPQSLQTLWLAFFWPTHTNEFPIGQCRFELQRMRKGDIPSYNTFTVTLQTKMASGSTGSQNVRIYAPAQDLEGNVTDKKVPVLPAPYDKGWLYCSLDVSEETNTSAGTIPLHFVFSDYLRKGAPTNGDDVITAVQYDFKVDKCSLVSTMPSVYPPVYKGKVIAVSDYRANTKAKLNYFVGGVDKEDPLNATFVSRNTPDYKLLLNRRTHGIQQPKRARSPFSIIIIALFLVPVILFFLFNKKAKSS
jgi:hypothetical protein